MAGRRWWVVSATLLKSRVCHQPRGLQYWVLNNMPGADPAPCGLLRVCGAGVGQRLLSGGSRAVRLRRAAGGAQHDPGRPQNGVQSPKVAAAVILNGGAAHARSTTGLIGVLCLSCPKFHWLLCDIGDASVSDDAGGGPHDTARGHQ
jgi:hypothetical protein